MRFQHAQVQVPVNLNPFQPLSGGSRTRLIERDDALIIEGLEVPMRSVVLSTGFALLVGSTGGAGPIHDVASTDDVAQLVALLDEGANPDERGPNGETALTTAIINSRSEIAELLLMRGARIDTRNSGGFTPLHAAAYVGLVDIAGSLLDLGADKDDQENKAGVSPLSIAAEEDNLEVARLLLSRGADAELAEHNGYTPLTRAIWRGHAEMAALLQGHGALCQPIEILEEPAFSECMASQER